MECSILLVCVCNGRKEYLVERLIIHGGLSISNTDEYFKEIDDALCQILEESIITLNKKSSRDAVLHSVKMLEDNPIFNAGTGSKLQSDGQIRMSAALMDGKNNKFSGVVNVQNIKNPIEAAEMLLEEKHTILSGDQAKDYCRKRGMVEYNPETSERFTEFKKGFSGKHGTVGAVALDRKGLIFSGTSTGGIGFEIPGRVSDSPTVAGTYASKNVGVSCTGIGEQITQQAVAAKIVTRVDDGMRLGDSVVRTIKESSKFDYTFGLISLDYRGNFEVGKTETVKYVFYAFFDGERIKSFTH